MQLVFKESLILCVTDSEVDCFAHLNESKQIFFSEIQTGSTLMASFKVKVTEEHIPSENRLGHLPNLELCGREIQRRDRFSHCHSSSTFAESPPK